MNMEENELKRKATSILSDGDFEEAEEHIRFALEIVSKYRIHKGKDCVAQRRLDSMMKSLSSAKSASASIRLGKSEKLFRSKYYASVTDSEGATVGICENPSELSTLLHIPFKKAYWMFANRIPGSEKAGPKASQGYQITLIPSEN